MASTDVAPSDGLAGLAATDAEMTRRHERIRAAMERDDLDLLLVFAPGWRRDSVRYVTCAEVRAGEAFVAMSATGDVRAWSCAATDTAALGLWASDVRWGNLGADALRWLIGAGRAASIGVVHLEQMPVRLHDLLLQVLPTGTKVSSATELLNRVRLVKSSEEIARMRAAGRLADEGWERFVAALEPGVREFEVVAQVESHLKGLGARDNFMIIASGGADVRGMTPATDRALVAGDLVRTELTPQASGYYTQICRSAVVGEPTDAHRRSFELFAEATQAGLDAVRPGVTAHDIAKAENDVFRRHGFGEYCTSQYTRVRGHGLGMHFDEAPALLEGDETVLEEDATFIVHPNTFTPIAGYHVLGDPVVVTADGYERLIETELALFSTSG